MAQSEEHSPGKRKVPGSNPGRSLGHFFRSVISHSSLSLFHVPGGGGGCPPRLG